MAEVPILEMRNVGKTFVQNGRAIEALRGADLSVKKGEFICLIGASGCGKSTLLRLAAGFETPTTGEALMWGMPIAGPGPTRGMVFQDYGLFPWLTVRDNVGFGPKSRGRGKQEIKEPTERFIELVGLSNFADLHPHQLSGGMKQRVAIARALAMQPRVLLMDEPFAALDALTRRKMQEELLRLWDDARFTLLFVTHSIEEALVVGNRILLLSPHPGRVRAELNSHAYSHASMGGVDFRESVARIHRLLFDTDTAAPAGAEATHATATEARS